MLIKFTGNDAFLVLRDLCGGMRPAPVLSQPGDTTRRAVVALQGRETGDERARWCGSHPGTTPLFCGTTGAVFVGPTVVLGPKPWSPRGPSFHTGNRACGTTVVPLLYPGVGTTVGPSTTPPWDHTLVPDLSAEGGPARSDGARGTGQAAALTADRGL